MKKCPYCFTELDDRASICSSCRKKVGKKGRDGIAKKYTSPITKLILLLFLIGLIPTALTQFTKSDSDNNKKQPGIHITKKGYVAATTEQYLSMAVKIYASGDMNAFYKLMNSNPNIFPLKEGVRVYLEDVKLKGIVKIRPEGSTVSIWTIREAID